MIYLDHASTTPIYSEILEIMNGVYQDAWANPSSLHRGGQKSSSLLYEARRQCAEILGVDHMSIYFTPSATISNQAIIASCTHHGHFETITTTIDHKATLELQSLEKYQHTMKYAPVDSEGFVIIDKLIELITDNTRIISIILGHNEIGTIQRIQEISQVVEMINTERVIHDLPSIILHVDAVQTPSYINLRTIVPLVHALTISSHKIYGPKGSSLLYIEKGIQLTSFIPGGGQEHNLVSGTENVPAIVGLSHALRIAQLHASNTESITTMIHVRDKIIAQLISHPMIIINGHWTIGSHERLPNNIHITIRDTRQDIFMSYLDMQNIAVSNGSACQSGAPESSYVIEAINPKLNQSRAAHIRLTWGPHTTEEDIEKACKIILNGIDKQIGLMK